MRENEQEKERDPILLGVRHLMLRTGKCMRTAAIKITQRTMKPGSQGDSVQQFSQQQLHLADEEIRPEKKLSGLPKVTQLVVSSCGFNANIGDWLPQIYFICNSKQERKATQTTLAR